MARRTSRNLILTQSRSGCLWLHGEQFAMLGVVGCGPRFDQITTPVLLYTLVTVPGHEKTLLIVRFIIAFLHALRRTCEETIHISYE